VPVARLQLYGVGTAQRGDLGGQCGGVPGGVGAPERSVRTVGVSRTATDGPMPAAQAIITFSRLLTHIHIINYCYRHVKGRGSLHE